MKILIVEDNEKNIEAAKKQLVEHELTIMKSFTQFFNAFSRYAGHEFKDNQEVLNKLAEFDCVLTDINLPSPHDREGEVNGATGFAIALRAIEAGVAYIGVLTDMDHHADVHSKAMDMWIHQKGPFTVGKSKVFLDSYNYVSGGHKAWGKMLKYQLLQ